MTDVNVNAESVNLGASLEAEIIELPTSRKDAPKKRVRKKATKESVVKAATKKKPAKKETKKKETKKKPAKKETKKVSNTKAAAKPKKKRTLAQASVFSWKKSEASWPPALGDKVRLVVPKEARGRVAKVIATEKDMTPKSTRLAPKGKVRVLFNGKQFTVSKESAFAPEFSQKDLLSFL